MRPYLPSKPGWYQDPDQPRALRHWDGAAWTDRCRPRPAWYIGTDRFDFDHALDRSPEGPVHPHELREPVVSGALSRDWLPWRPRQSDASWPKAVGQAPLRTGQPPRIVTPARLGPARRPLLAMVCLLVVAVAVVVSSVAFITPYEIKRPAPIALQAAPSKSVGLASLACAGTISNVRHVLSARSDPRALSAAAGRLDLLRQRISAMSWTAGQQGPVDEWLGTLALISRDQREYAAAIGPPARPGASKGSTLRARAQAQAASVRLQTLADAAKADRFSANLALGPSCRLGLDQPA